MPFEFPDNPASNLARNANLRLVLWHSLQFSLGVAGAAAALSNVGLALFAVLITLPLTLATLTIGSRADGENALLTTFANAIAVSGMLCFVALLLMLSLLPALLVLLWFAQLAINLTTRKPLQLYFGLLSGFVALMLGAAETISGSYILLLAVWGFCISQLLPQLWVQGRASSLLLISNQRSTPSVLKPALLVVAIAGLIYLLMPRLPAANVGGRLAHSSQPQQNAAWQSQAGLQDGTENQSDDQIKRDDKLSEAYQDGPKPLWQGDHDRRSEYDYPGFRESFSLAEAADSRRQGDGQDLNALIAVMQAPHGAYLKTRTFNYFDGSSWSVKGDRFHKYQTDISGHLVLPTAAPAGPEAEQYSQQLTFKQTINAWIPAAGDPQEVWLPSNVIALDRWNHPVAPGALRAGDIITVKSSLNTVSGRIANSAPPPDFRDQQLPQDLDPRVIQLAYQVTSGASSPLQKAELLEQHLRNNYQYSFDSIFASQGVTPVAEFLFESRQGHCEYFASAMAILLRSLEIPARLVTGFSATTQNPVTGYFEIRGLDGHAWVEAWINGRWLTFEPTAFYQLPSPQSDSELQSSADLIDHYVEQRQRQQAATGAAGFSISAMLRGLWQIIYLGLLLPAGVLIKTLFWFWPAWLLLAGLLAASWIFRDRWWPQSYSRWILWRLQKGKPAARQHELQWSQQWLERLATLLKQPRQRGEPVEQWLQRLKVTTGDSASEELEQWSRFYNQHWYGTEGADVEAANASAASIRALALKLAIRLQQKVAGFNSTKRR
ncbi:transglutaminaseTgpA domain-containing protein [Oceanobacter mangrovi]|uniref:transglutaminase family protein n=1 Tax=Oceanobacter mangrovi TaxID=2862510 RepID=UPI001C8EA9FF|nr:transglutaminase domain-containing protein [Oceanobacter mangrovi]